MFCGKITGANRYGWPFFMRKSVQSRAILCKNVHGKREKLQWRHRNVRRARIATHKKRSIPGLCDQVFIVLWEIFWVVVEGFPVFSVGLVGVDIFRFCVWWEDSEFYHFSDVLAVYLEGW